MSNTSIMIVLIAVCVIVPYGYQNYLRNKLLRQLYELKTKNQQEAFMKLLDSFQSRFCLSAFTILFMKFNYYLDAGKYEDGKQIFPDIMSLKLNTKNAVAAKLRMFSSSIQNKDYEYANEIKNSLMSSLNAYRGKNAEVIKGEVEQIDKIYLQKDVTILPNLVEALESTNDQTVKELLCFRIAKLYYVINDGDAVNKYLDMAYNYAKNEQSKLSIKHIIENHSELA